MAEKRIKRLSAKAHAQEAERLLDWVGDPSNRSRQEDAREMPALLAASTHASLATYREMVSQSERRRRV
jgi:hypothetical protein